MKESKLNTETIFKPFQICPKCNGQGIVDRPPWIAGDIFTWTSSSSNYICDLCNGSKAIPLSKEIKELA